MRIKTFIVGPFQMNAYIIADEKSAECALVDPADDIQSILQYVQENKLIAKAMLVTHGHLDHIRFISQIQRQLQVPLYMGQKDLPLLESLAGQGRMFNLDVADPPKVDIFLDETQTLKIGNQEVRFLHTPGHSPGSYSFLINGNLFAGDVLFKDSIGRTDLYGGDYTVLMRSISDKFLTLPDETTVYPGHGPATTIGREKRNNPFLRM